MSCCNDTSITVLEFDVGSLGTRKFMVCKKHLQTEPWNKYIVSQEKIGDDLD